MRPLSITAFLMLVSFFCAAQAALKTGIPDNFVRDYYDAYSGVPTSSRLSPFYADDVVLDDPTYDFIGRDKVSIFRNFDKANLVNEYRWRIDQTIVEGNKLVTEGLLSAKLKGVPYTMRFVNIFHFRDGLIVRQFDYFDNAEYYAIKKSLDAKK